MGRYKATSNPKVFWKDGKAYLLINTVESTYGPHMETRTFIPYPYEDRPVKIPNTPNDDQSYAS